MAFCVGYGILMGLHTALGACGNADILFIVVSDDQRRSG